MPMVKLLTFMEDMNTRMVLLMVMLLLMLLDMPPIIYMLAPSSLVFSLPLSLLLMVILSRR